jgi:hypothetical protein
VSSSACGRAFGVLEHLHRLAADLLLVDGEVAVVHFLGGGRQVHFLEETLVVGMLGEAAVFLLEDAGVVALHRVAVGVVLPVLLHGVDEEQAQHLDALGRSRFSLSRCSLMVRWIIWRCTGQRLHVAVGLAGAQVLLAAGIAQLHELVALGTGFLPDDPVVR